MSRDERHEQAVAAAVATIPAFDSDTDDVRAGIDAYLRSLADQGDPLVRLIEVVEWLEGQYVPSMAAAVQRRFATEQRRNKASS
jgi:hypothetical protein